MSDFQASGSPSQEPDPDPYEVRADGEWSETVGAWKWEDRGVDYVKVGDCPRCGHQMSVISETKVDPIAALAKLGPDAVPVLAEGERVEAAVAAGRDVIGTFMMSARCNCSTVHPGAPKDAGENAGCGYRGAILRPSGPGQ